MLIFKIFQFLKKYYEKKTVSTKYIFFIIKLTVQVAQLIYSEIKIW